LKSPEMKFLVLFALFAFHSQAAVVPIDSEDTWHELEIPENHETFVFKGLYLNVAEDDARSGRVIHGIPASDGQFPWVARMSIITPVGGVLCSASLIASHWILGASHCFHGIDVTAIQFGLGSVDRDSPTMFNVFSDRWAWPPIVSGIRPDFALFHTVAMVPFGPNIDRIQLPSTAWAGNLWVGRDVQIIGWGGAVGGLPRFLQFGNFIVGVPGDCNMFDFEMCAYPPSGSSTSAQGGDSGGPMALWEGGQPILVGVLWGVAGLRQIGTRTAPYLQWINDNTGIPLW